jgi:hypothetical protein
MGKVESVALATHWSGEFKGNGCGRCGDNPAPKICWWCARRLCEACWGEWGQCGHGGADAVDEKQRERMYRYRLWQEKQDAASGRFRR